MDPTMTAGQPIRMLVVDDDEKIRTALRRGLSYEGYRVVEAARRSRAGGG